MNLEIFNFLCRYLSNMNIPYFVSADTFFTMADFDLGLRNSILKEKAIGTVSSLDQFDPKVLYHFSDYYNCNYTFFQLPDARFFFVGPYLLKNMDESEIRQFLLLSEIPETLISQMKDYYYSLVLIRDQASFYGLLRQCFIDICQITEPIEHTFDLRTLESREAFLKKHQFIVPEDPILSMNLLEKRYQSEDDFLSAVTQGNTAKAMSIVNKMNGFRITARTTDELRNQKNLMISLNTLLRRTSYAAGVHPFYIDTISANYARLIENATSIQDMSDIIPYMVRSYCELVEKRSTSLYSEPIRQILVTIDASIDGDLSLKRFANELFLNTSYLSSLFKKETGMTLTDYVNHHRIGYAKRLLKSTTLSIQDIATTVGISDIHYFTRLFRRETGLSPREFRKL